MRIFSQVQNGKCKFKLGDFVCYPINMTDVLIDFLDCLIRYYKREVAAIRFFDQNQDLFLLVLSPSGIYIIDEYGNGLQDLYNVMTIDDFTKQIIADIEDSIDDWTQEFYMDKYRDQIDTDKYKISKKIARLKSVSNIGID